MAWRGTTSQGNVPNRGRFGQYIACGRPQGSYKNAGPRSPTAYSRQYRELNELWVVTWREIAFDRDGYKLQGSKDLYLNSRPDSGLGLL